MRSYIEMDKKRMLRRWECQESEKIMADLPACWRQMGDSNPSRETSLEERQVQGIFQKDGDDLPVIQEANRQFHQDRKAEAVVS